MNNVTQKILSLSIIVALAATIACTDENGARRALNAQGFTDIKVTGYSYFGCGKDDQYHTGFTARNSMGTPVEGVVCCGITKNCTVRF